MKRKNGEQLNWVKFCRRLTYSQNILLLYCLCCKDLTRFTSVVAPLSVHIVKYWFLIILYLGELYCYLHFRESNLTFEILTNGCHRFI